MSRIIHAAFARRGQPTTACHSWSDQRDRYNLTFDETYDRTQEDSITCKSCARYIEQTQKNKRNLHIILGGDLNYVVTPDFHVFLKSQVKRQKVVNERIRKENIEKAHAAALQIEEDRILTGDQSMPTQIEMQAMSAQIDQARSFERIAKALESIADSLNSITTAELMIKEFNADE